MPGVLIIGYGNPLRGDDALGWRVAERLRSKMIDRPEVEILTLHQLTPELMDPISRAGRVIFIDASTEGEPGEIRHRQVQPAEQPSQFTHHFVPEVLLAGARDLFGHAPEPELFTVAGGCFEFGEELSPAVRDAVERLVKTIFALV